MNSIKLRTAAPSLSSYVAVEQSVTAPTSALTHGTRVPSAMGTAVTAGACAVLGNGSALVAPAAVLRDDAQGSRPRGAPV